MFVTTLLLTLAPGQDLLRGQERGDPPTRFPRVQDLRGPERWVHADRTGRAAKHLLVGAHHPEAGSAVVWQDLREGHAGLYFQRFGPGGERIGDDRSVQGHRTTRLRSPAVALNADGTGLVAWILPLGGRDGVRVLFFDAEGEFRRGAWVESRDERPAKASRITDLTVATSEHGSAVVFRDDRGVHVRRYGLDGRGLPGLETMTDVRTEGDLEARYVGNVVQVAFLLEGRRVVTERLGPGSWVQRTIGWRMAPGSTQDATGGALTLGGQRFTTEDGEVLVAEGRRPAERVATDEASARQDRLALAQDPRGGALLVWEDDRSGATELWWRRASVDGTFTAEQVLVDEGRPRWATAAVHTSGMAYVVWKEADGALLGASLDATGRRGPAMPLDLDQTVNPHEPPAITAVGDGFVVAWGREDGGLFARRIDRFGKAQRLEKLVRSTSRCSRPDLAAYPDGRTLLAWDEVRAGERSPRVQVAVLDRQGTFSERPSGVRLPRGAGWDPSVAIGANGRAMIVYCSGELTDRNRDVLSQRLDLRGKPQGPLQPLTTFLREQDFPEVAALEGGGYVVAWEDDISGHDHTYLRRVAFDGSLGPVRTLDPGLLDGPETCTRPLVIPAGDGLLCAWTDRRRARHLDLVLLALGPDFDG